MAPTFPKPWTATVVDELDLEHAGPVTGLEDDRAFGRFARRLAFRGAFDSVIDGIAQQVFQGADHLFQHRPVQFGLAAANTDHERAGGRGGNARARDEQ